MAQFCFIYESCCFKVKTTTAASEEILQFYMQEQETACRQTKKKISLGDRVWQYLPTIIYLSLRKAIPDVVWTELADGPGYVELEPSTDQRQQKH